MSYRAPKYVSPSALTPAQVVDIRQLVMDGYSNMVIAERFGIDARNVKPISDGRLRKDVPVDVPSWFPLCMSREEFELTRTKVGSNFNTKTPRPCDDCDLGFAADMRLLGLCNGTPGGIEEDESVKVA